MISLEAETTSLVGLAPEFDGLYWHQLERSETRDVFGSVRTKQGNVYLSDVAKNFVLNSYDFNILIMFCSPGYIMIR